MMFINGDIRISVAVMAHPARAARARGIIERFPELDMELVLDPSPDERPSALRTARLAWAAARPEATHHLVLQDDVLLAADFPKRLTRLVAEHRTRPISLFAEWGACVSYAVRIAALLGRGGVSVVEQYLPCQGLVLPAGLTGEFVEFVDHLDPRAVGHADDVALLRFMERRSLLPYLPIGMLLDHDDQDSLAANRIHGPRRATLEIPAYGGSELEPQRVVPQLCWWQGMADICLSTGNYPEEWMRVSAEGALGDCGVSGRDLTAALRSWERAFEGNMRELRSLVSDTLLYQLWLTAVALGCLARENGVDTAVDIRESTRTQQVSQALSTMAPGGMRRFIPDRSLGQLAACSLPLAREGTEFGWELGVGLRAAATARAERSHAILDVALP